MMKNKNLSKESEIKIAKAMALTGLVITVFNYLLETLFFGEATLTSNIYAKLFSALLLYLSGFYYVSIKKKKPLKKSLMYIKKSSNYIYALLILFAFSSFLGFILKENLIFLDEFLKNIIKKTSGLNALELIVYILLNNGLAAALSILLGIFIGIFPLLNSIANGVVLGYVLGKAHEIGGLLVFWRLLPHGIFELPAILIALGLGTKLGFVIFSKSENKREEFKELFYNSINVFLTVIVPLLVIAAIIEGVLISFMG